MGLCHRVAQETAADALQLGCRENDAAGEEGALSAAKAWALFASVVAGLLLIMFLSQHSGLANLLPNGKSPEALSEDARVFVAKLGYPDPPVDDAYWFDADPGYFPYSSRIPTPQRYRDMGAEFPLPLQFWYRQSPRPFRTGYPFQVTSRDPMPFYSGEWKIGMDSAGRLNYFEPKTTFRFTVSRSF